MEFKTTDDVEKVVREVQSLTEDVESNGSKGSGDMCPLMTEIADSAYVQYSKIPDAVRNNMLDLGKLLYQADRERLVITGEHMTGKTFTVEQFAYHAERILHRAKMVPPEESVAVFYADARRYEGAEQERFISLVANTIENFKGEVIFYTNNYFTASLIEQTAPPTRTIIELAPEILNELKGSGVQLSDYSFASGFSGDFDKSETTKSLRAYHKQQLVDHYHVDIPQNFIKNLVSRVYTDAEITKNRDGSEAVGAIPMGYWVRFLNEALGEVVFKPEKYIDQKGSMDQNAVIDHIIQENTDLFAPTNALNDMIEAFAEMFNGPVGEELGISGQNIAFSVSPDDSPYGAPDTQSQEQKDAASGGTLDYSDMDTLADRVKNSVKGQDRVVDEVSEGFKVAAAGLNDDDKPVRSMLFLGPTGVGKTQLAKTLSCELTQEPMNVIRLDMSEYAEEHNSQKLFGSPAGYVGHEKGGVLTNQVIERPRSVILLDEVEKAHPKIWDTFLQVLDAGRMTDSHGKTVDFTQTVIVMTSNLGANEEVQNGGGFTAGLHKLSHDEEMTRRRKNAFKNMETFFKPEFINRLDDVFVFDVLPKDTLMNIVGMEFDVLAQRVADKSENTLTLSAPSTEVAQKIVDMSDSSRYGARDIKRTVRKQIAYLVADSMNKAVKSGTKDATITLRLNESDGHIVADTSSESQKKSGKKAKKTA